jgi:predicted CopG family antitoxin
MAVKTITIDLNAYELLSQQKRDKESFSDVIKRKFRPKVTVDQFLVAVRENLPSRQTLDAVERTTTRIRKQKLRTVR